MALFTAYLGRIKVVTSNESANQGIIMRLMVELAYRRRLFEVILDFFLISVTYYLAFWIRNGLRMSDLGIELYLQTLPVVLASSYLSFFVFGVYRGVWRFIGFENLLVYMISAIGSLIPAYLFLFLTNRTFISLGSILLLFGVLLLLGLAGTRSSFTFLDMFSKGRENTNDERVLIFGIEDASELALRWILMNPQLGYKPVGLIDVDRLNVGRKIHGIEILGGIEHLEDIIAHKQIDGLILAIPNANRKSIEQIKAACRERRCWIRTLSLEFKDLE